MVDLAFREYTAYDAFARDWHADTLDQRGVTLTEARDRGLINEDDTRLLWQLLDQLDKDEFLIRIPEWLAEEKVGYADSATPTEFVGRIERETEKAILLADSAAARPLMKLAHRIHHFKQGIENIENDEDRRAWLERRLREKRREFETRDDREGLRDQWLPKSQIIHAVRRVG